MFKRLTGIFERLVRPILLGYLGKYVKDIQLKIAVWREEVVSLENVELALDAFDHLQLPFAMKLGKVDRLSIKVPWTKLGSQPIEITFEGVRICVSPRDDQEWSWDAVEKRELAAKKARLAAAEIAYFSTHACENQAGQLFTAKILDSIQVSIRNVNILYCDLSGYPAPILFGFKFSSLTIMKQNPIGGGNQVHKIVEIKGFEVYSRVVQEDANNMDVENALFEGEKCDFLLGQCDVSMLISIKRSGKLDLIGPKYSISANVASLVISLEKDHLHQFMILSDYLCSCRLREKYGRFRPSYTPSSRSNGWQVLWWHYALESVLLDVRKKLKKTSWRYCGQRLGFCRKYINLYKRKLHFIQQGQSIGEDILLQLEQMEEEKELDVDDILSLRSAAEFELQELLSNSSIAEMDSNGSSISSENSGNDESSIVKSRGWLNVLSRGMLGAGGADGTSQFSGGVFDEVKKGTDEENKFSLSSVHINIHQICATFWSKDKARDICKLNFKEAIVNCEIFEKSAVISTIVESAMMENKFGKEVVHLTRKALVQNDTKDSDHSSSGVHVELSVKHGNELLIKGLLPKLEVNFDAECFIDLTYFFDVLKSLKIQNERVLSLLSKIEDVDARLISKVEHLLSSHQNVIWDVSVSDITVYVPSSNAEQHMVLGLGALFFKSKSLLDSSSSNIGEGSYALKDYLSSRSLHNISDKFKLQHLYDHFEIELAEFEMKMKMPYQSEKISILEKFSACLNVAHCLIPDEAMLKQLEVHIVSSHDNFCEFHCHPFAISFLFGFIGSLSAREPSNVGEKSTPTIDNGKLPSFEFQEFGFSNYLETGSSEWASIPLYHYPFVTIQNSGLLDCLDSSLLHSSPYWGKKCNSVNSPDFSFKKGLSFSHTSQSKSTTTIEGLIHSSIFGVTNALRIDLQLSRIRVHFHDSSCIIGTITLPTAKSSICISGDSMDILCSAVGLSLNSSWYEPIFDGSLWGPSSPNFSPILNLRVKKERGIKLALSIGIQHVCCILPSEYLAIIIGYFSLPDWIANSQPERESHDASNAEYDNSVLYKFEVLDSTLLLPIESSEYQFLKVGIPQLYCSFLNGSSSNDMLLKGIPPECLVLSCKSGTRLDCLNIFGRDLSMSSRFSKDDGAGSLMIDTGSGLVDYCLVTPLSVDVWIRIPWEEEFSCEGSSFTTSVMVKIRNCQIVADGDPFIYGFEALLDVIDQFSTVSNQSKFFKSDILQFRQLKRSIVKTSDVSVVASGLILTEIRCSIDELLVKICLKNEAVAMAKMQLTCSASLNGDTLLSMSLDFSFLELYSLAKATLLAKFNSAGSSSSVLEVFLSETANNEDELLITLPSLDIWLHLPNWTEVVDSIIYYARLNENPHLNTKSKNSALLTDDSLVNNGVSDSPDTLDYSSNSSELASRTRGNASVLIIRSDNISIIFHFPLCVSEADLDFEVAGDYRESHEYNSLDLIGKQGCNSISVACHSRSTKVWVNGGNVKLKSDWERLSGAVSIYENDSVFSWPIFHMLKLNMKAEIENNQVDPMHVKLVVECDRSEFSFSHRVLCLWPGLQFDVPEAGSSYLAFGSINFEVHLKDVSFLLSDGRWNCGGPLFQLLLQDIFLHCNFAEDNIDGSLTADLQVDYNNIHKVSWEPFVEPWQFQLIVGRKSEISALVDSSMMTYIDLKSTKHLNFNITESLVECISRTIEMIKDAWGLKRTHGLPKSQMLLKSPLNEYVRGGRYASYIIKNLTSLPFSFHVYQGEANPNMSDISEEKDRNYVKPSCCVPIFINETPEELLFPHKRAHSSDSLSEKQSDGVAHHFITIQFDGMSMPTAPLSMDLVRQTYFEADFSKAYGSDAEKTESYSGSGYVVPVVYDVSVYRSIKLIQLYSTVLLLNTTSMQLELWFDIPFGVSAKRLGPLNPCQELPLPLLSSEAGRLRWCPVGDSHLCSEAYDISTLISHESKIGTFKSSVCYPSRASGHPFYCCLSVVKIRLNSSSHFEKGSLSARDSPSVQNNVQLTQLNDSKQQYVHRLIISTPLVVNNYLPVTVKLSIQTTGGDLSAYADLPEMGTSFHYIDPLRDLKIEINIHGFKPQDLQFPHGETFYAMAKFNGTKFVASETLGFMPLPYMSNGAVHVSVEKMMDAISGTRELHISVPFLLYNCTGFPLSISESSEMGISCIIPSCYEFDEQVFHVDKKDGLSLVSTTHKSPGNLDGLKNSLPEDQNLFTWMDNNSQSKRFLSKTSISSISSNVLDKSNSNSLGQQKPILSSHVGKNSSSGFNYDVNLGYRKVRAYMYSPTHVSSGSELTVKVSRCPRESTAETLSSSFWSNAFSLAPPSGSTTVIVPQLSSSGSLVLSAALTAVSGPLTGRTSAITFQPRYVISNACNKKLRFKQKGTGAFFCLHERKQAHIHWTDTTRDLLVSICYEEPGWEWSGGFSPDHLGDIQVKMRNSSGAVNIIRVEVQNADASTGDEKIIGNLHGNSGTNLILLSEDDTEFMPYRIDNFSKESLRIYQQKCETYATAIQSYSSSPYAWDEPCYPHNLIFEVPGERVLGSYALDDVKVYTPVYLPSTSEKPDRTLYLSVHAEGATKVLSVIDSRSHILDTMNDSSIPQFGEKRKYQKDEKFVNWKEKFSFVIPYMTLSLINSYPEEVLFAYVTNVTINLLQSLDRQKLSFQISSMQIENPSHVTPYPVTLSFDHGCRCNVAGIDNLNGKAIGQSSVKIGSDQLSEPVFYLTVSKWRKKDISLVSFEYIILRVGDICLKLEEEMILKLIGLVKNISSTLQGRVVPFSEEPILQSHIGDTDLVTDLPKYAFTSEYFSSKDDQNPWANVYVLDGSNKGLPLAVPIGAPWQQIYLLARRQKKIYVEVFDVGPINLNFSFSSNPWMIKNGLLKSREYLIHRSLMALTDVEGARINFKPLKNEHLMASWISVQDIIMKHYSRQVLHEMYKVFGSAGVIGNPVGFARNVVLGIRDFLSVPARSILQSPGELITGMAQGTTSLLGNTIFAISDAATQFSKAAHKGVVVFTFDDQAVSRLEKQESSVPSSSKGVINDVLEGLTGLLQLPINEVEKRGLPGILSGVALGITGLVAKPTASILKVTEKTAASIRNRSMMAQMGPQHVRTRLPRCLSEEVPLRSYSWEEAIGASVLRDIDDGAKYKDEVLVVCKALKRAGQFVVMTKRLVLVVGCSSLVDLGKPEFRGIAIDPEWVIESEISLENVIQHSIYEDVIHIVVSIPDTISKQKHNYRRSDSGMRTALSSSPTTLPISLLNLELPTKQDAEFFLQILKHTIERQKERGSGRRHILHQGTIRQGDYGDYGRR